MLFPALHHYSQLAVMSPPTLFVAAGIIKVQQQKLSRGLIRWTMLLSGGHGAARHQRSPPAAVVSDHIIAEPLQNTSKSQQVRLD